MKHDHRTKGRTFDPGSSSGSTQPSGPSSEDLDIELQLQRRYRVDIEEFEELYRKYRPKIYKYIFMTFSDGDLASNLTDESFSKALDNLGTFRWQGYSFGAWLFQIARNVMRQEFRKRKIRLEVPFDPEIHDRDNGFRLDVEAEKMDEYRLLKLGLDALRPERREIMINHYSMGMTTRQIGLVMEMNESTVKAHLIRGRHQLLKFLVAQGVERGLSPTTLKKLRKATAQQGGWKILKPGGDDR